LELRYGELTTCYVKSQISLQHQCLVEMFSRGFGGEQLYIKEELATPELFEKCENARLHYSITYGVRGVT
jgi:hypothetical protein